MRFYASHLGSGQWGLYDGGVMTWLASDLSENEAKQQAADRNVIFDQWGQRQESERRQVSPPIQVESATWTAAGELDYWVRERQEWWCRVRGADGHHVWIKATYLRPAEGAERPWPVAIARSSPRVERPCDSSDTGWSRGYSVCVAR